MVRSYRGTTFDRLKELVDDVVVFRRKVSGTRGDGRKRDLEFDRQRTERFPLILRQRSRFWSRGQERRSSDAVPVADELGVGRLKKWRYERLGSSNDRNCGWGQLVVPYDAVSV
jgi:hypothetical protein